MFQFEKSCFVDEIKATYTSYSHPSGLKVINIQNEDPQNVAGILLQTIPHSSNGCAHVLEHIVLCGSKKFDVKDPFFSMLRRSVAGFANAFTGSDFTCYPFAAHLKEDFFNLFEVYLDAVFYPLLDKGSFLQEGARLTDEGFKGIVFNEMKQAHSSLYDRLHHATLEQLFPDSPYRFDSGGIPKEIVTLTHQDLLDFHKEFYCPSKATIFLYGNIDIEEKLHFIEKMVHLPLKMDTQPTKRVYQKPFTHKKVVHSYYPAASDEVSHHMTIGFLVGSQNDPKHLLEALYLKMLLADHDACPIQRAIMGENLASSVEVLTDMEVLQPYLYFIFKDVTDSKKLVETFDRTLAELYDKGFDLESKKGALHQLKIAFLNTVESGYPTGLTLFFRAFLPALNGADPLEMVQFKERIEDLEKTSLDDNHLKELLKTLFLENSHRVELHFSPKQNLLEEELPPKPFIDEKLRLQIDEEMRLIDAKQQRSSDASCLPLLHIDQIPKTITSYPVKLVSGQIPATVHTTWTNGLSYIDFFIDLPHFTDRELPYLSLLLHLLGEIGTKNHSFEELIEKKELLVSSLDFGIQLIDDRLVFAGTMDCLSENIQEAFLLLEEVLSATIFTEKERVQEIIKDLFTRLKSSFTQRGVGRCVLKTKSILNSGYKALEQIRGFSFYFWLKSHLEQSIESTLQELEAVFHKLLCAKGKKELVCATDLESEQLPSLRLPIKETLPPYMSHPLYNLTGEAPPFFGYAVPLQAAENALTFPSFTYMDPMAPIAKIVVQLVKHLQLHPILREKHGAYGTSMSIDLDQGLMTMFTSCDPNIDLTYEIFTQVLTPILEGEYTEQDLYEAKLAALQKTEGIVPLNQRASHEYFLKRVGRTEEIRLSHRKALIEADRSAIRNCVTSIIKNLSGGVKATIASKKGLEGLKKHPSILIEL